MTVSVKTAVSPDGQLYFHQMEWVDLAGVNLVPTHEHTYGHTMRCLSGRAELWSARDGTVTLTKGDMIDVPAGVAHDMIGLEAGTVVECVHIMRLEDGTVVPFGYQLTGRQVLEITARM